MKYNPLMDLNPSWPFFVTESKDEETGALYSGPVINAVDWDAAETVLDYLKRQRLVPRNTRIIGEHVDTIDLADLGNV